MQILSNSWRHAHTVHTIQLRRGRPKYRTLLAITHVTPRFHPANLDT
jgi:hypothetical protein